MIYGLLHTDPLVANVQFENDCKKLFLRSTENPKRKENAREKCAFQNPPQ
jgi:hypothetical protein